MKKIMEVVAVLEKDENSGYSVRFPDFETCHAQGENFGQAVNNARDALYLHIGSMLFDDETLPVCQKVEDVDIEVGNLLTIISVDGSIAEFRENQKSHTVSATIPKWMYKSAKKNNIPLSQVLFEGLLDRLDVSEEIMGWK